MLSILLLGLLIGMRHAFEADHMAAVASLASRQTTLRQAMWQGSVWGLGHTLTLFIFGSVVLILGWVMPDRLAQSLEFAVGIMLLALGVDVIRRMIKQRVHYHVHQHAGGVMHFHAHSHQKATHGQPQAHAHKHVSSFPVRALMVGMMHGMAGSAALILLTLDSVSSVWQGLAYILLFGLGSVAGMALLSVAIAIPLRYSSRGLTFTHNGLQGLIGLSTVAIGGHIVYQVGIVERLLLN